MKSQLQEIFEGLTEHSSDKWEAYFDVYQRYLEPFFGLPVTFVEVGVQKGGSLDMWAQVFTHPETKIIGVDIDPVCATLKYPDPRIEVVIGDQGKDTFWDDFLKKYPDIDIFIDDGGHFVMPQRLTLQRVFPHVNEGGIFICEDTHTSYMPYNGGGLGNRDSFIELSKDLVDHMHKSWWDTVWPSNFGYMKGLSSISFYDSMVVLEKKPTRQMQRIAPKRFS